MNKKNGKILKKVLNTLIGIGIVLCLWNPIVTLAADLSFQDNAISNIGNNDARISAKIMNSGKMNVTETGFYLGTSSGALTKCSNHDSGNWQYSKITVGFTMSQYWGSLNENTTYYYRFYAIADGNEYTSSEYSFKTTGGNVEKAELSFYENNVTGVTENDGRINAKISNPDGRAVTQTGFYIGTSPDVSKNGMNDSCNLTNSTITVGYTMSKYYGTLQPGTTYYYKFYAIGDGQEYCSETYSFTTMSPSQPAPAPVQPSAPTPEPVQPSAPTPTPERPQTPSSETTTEGQQGTPASKPEGISTTEGNNSVKTALSFYDNNVTKVTEKDGRISAKISNPDGRRVTETGFYIGTSDQLYQNAKHDDCNLTNTSISVGFTMSQYYGTLQPGSTYYYMYYAVGDGEEFFSDVYSFTTNAEVKTDSQSTAAGKGDSSTEKKSNITFSVKKVEDITHENARIGAAVNNPKKENITETGFYYGTNKSSMIKSLDADKGNWKTSISVSYDIGEYARVCLMSDTTYYYQFYVIIDGQEVASEISSFTTLSRENGNNDSYMEEVYKPNDSDTYEEEINENNKEYMEEVSNSGKKTYTIKLNADGGQVNPQSIKVVNGESYGSLPIPVREGYVFEGWYKNYIFWKEYVTEATVYKRGLGIIDTLNAKWREKYIFYVKFDANGGSVGESMRPVYEQDILGNLPMPTREGYDFVGWFTESVGGKQVNGDRIILGNEVYYAQWKERPKESARFSQNDEKWTAKNSAFKKKYPGSLIKEQGCYLCSLAMSLNNMGFRDTTPITLYERNLDDKGNPDSYIHDGSIKDWYNSYMKQKGIDKKLVHDRISIIDNNYESILKDTLLGTNSSGMNKKNYHLEQGVIIKLKKNDSENYHYILATHIAEDGTIRVNDPDNNDNTGGVWDINLQTVLKEKRLKNYRVVGLELWYLK